MKLDRKQALKEARRGVLFQGRELREAKDFPPEADGQEFFAMRDTSGNLTREGMEHVIRSGGAVMHGSKLIERLQDVPAEEELAAGDSNRLDAVEDDLDRQQAAIDARRKAVGRERQRAGETSQTDANVQSAPAPATPPPQPTHGQRPADAKKGGK